MTFWKKEDDKFGHLKALITSHENNKKEAFEGMRAYHQSEIAHKKDAISIYQTLITSVILIYGGLIAGIYNQSINGYESIKYLGWLILLVLGICSSLVTFFSNKKISKDNDRYNIYRIEYTYERDIIKLEDDLLGAGCTSHWHYIKNNNEKKPKSGYRYTKWILIAMNIMVCFIGLIGALIIHIASISHKNIASKPTHIVVDSPLKIR